MFDVGLPEILVILLLAVFVFGPDRLPDVARQAGRFVRTARLMVSNARADLTRELGPGFADLDLKDLDPRKALQKHVFDVLDEDEEQPDRPVSASHRPLLEGERPPYDADAT
ncbi:MAG TPA: sec-independent translocase [Nocardioidaceae bacterium]|nr:sec-independent translocase [Actinomycetota bacterium]MDQ3422517.1 sec-independent translocase [Actinomycetota bacterium]HEV8056402.1 sec-independent translocase [Nocardioidaceae bacterium]